VFAVFLNEVNAVHAHCTIDRQQAYQEDNACGTDAGIASSFYRQGQKLISSDKSKHKYMQLKVITGVNSYALKSN
jgi:hypothetical protein